MPAPGACVRAKNGLQWPPSACSLNALLPNVSQSKGRLLGDGEQREDQQKQDLDALHQLLQVGDQARGRSIPPHQAGRWPSAAWQPSPLRLIERAKTVTLFYTLSTVPYRTLACMSLGQGTA